MWKPWQPKPSQPVKPSEEKVLSPLEKNNELFQKWKGLVFRLAQDNSSERLQSLRKDMSEKNQYLKQKYPDCEERRVFHFLTFSTGLYTNPRLSDEDFPGDDSVEKFINEMVEKHK